MIQKVVFLLSIGLVGLLGASQNVTIQVISAVYEKSVTKGLDAKVKHTRLEVYKKVENGRFVVTLGEFKNEHAAQAALKKARHMVSSDAFIRPVVRHGSSAAHTAASADSVAHGTTAAHGPKILSPASHMMITTQQDTPIAPASQSVAHEATSVAVVVSTSNTAVSTSPAAPVSVSCTPKGENVSECDKRKMHKNELSEAISYYKNSPYHCFEPVTLRQ